MYSTYTWENPGKTPGAGGDMSWGKWVAMTPTSSASGSIVNKIKVTDWKTGCSEHWHCNVLKTQRVAFNYLFNWVAAHRRCAPTLKPMCNESASLFSGCALKSLTWWMVIWRWECWDVSDCGLRNVIIEHDLNRLICDTGPIFKWILGLDKYLLITKIS